jgi:hypothetical protein
MVVIGLTGDYARPITAQSKETKSDDTHNTIMQAPSTQLDE